MEHEISFHAKNFEHKRKLSTYEFTAYQKVVEYANSIFLMREKIL